jgi:voltage-gated potassium channel
MTGGDREPTHQGDGKKAALVKNARGRLLSHLIAYTDKIMVGLALIWVGLMIADLVGEISPALMLLNNAIWAVFGIDFAVKFIIAPRKMAFLRANWITLLSLVLPAFRLLRIVQALGALRALSFLRILTSLNRNMGALGRAMGKRGIGYVAAISLIVLFAGAAGMYYFEKPDQLIEAGFADVARNGGGLKSYGDAVWWTAMLMTTIGSQYWPVTIEGRALCFALSMFSLGVFGYITAALASFFVGERKQETAAPAAALKDIAAELSRLREEVRKLESNLTQY